MTAYILYDLHTQEAVDAAERILGLKDGGAE